MYYIVCQWSLSAKEKIKAGKENGACVAYMGGMQRAVRREESNCRQVARGGFTVKVFF